MTPKQYLQQIQRLDLIIRHKKAELSELKAMDGLKAVELNGDRVRASPDGNAPFVRTVERISELEREIDKLLAQYVDEKDRIINEIHSLPNALHIKILYRCYVLYQNLEEIAKELNYSYFYIRHAHGHALQSFGRTVLKDSTQ